MATTLNELTGLETSQAVQTALATTETADQSGGSSAFAATPPKDREAYVTDLYAKLEAEREAEVKRHVERTADSSPKSATTRDEHGRFAGTQAGRRNQNTKNSRQRR